MWKYITGNIPTASKSGFEFKMQNSYEKRKDESIRLKTKFPDKVPVILEKAESSILPNINKQKYLMQRDVTIGQFLYIIRTSIKLDASESIFLIINNNVVPATSSTIGEVYDNYGDKDGFLYIFYSAQQTYGFF